MQKGFPFRLPFQVVEEVFFLDIFFLEVFEAGSLPECSPLRGHHCCQRYLSRFF